MTLRGWKRIREQSQLWSDHRHLYERRVKCKLFAHREFELRLETSLFKVKHRESPWSWTARLVLFASYGITEIESRSGVAETLVDAELKAGLAIEAIKSEFNEGLRYWHLDYDGNDLESEEKLEDR